MANTQGKLLTAQELQALRTRANSKSDYYAKSVLDAEVQRIFAHIDALVGLLREAREEVEVGGGTLEQVEALMDRIDTALAIHDQTDAPGGAENADRD